MVSSLDHSREVHRFILPYRRQIDPIEAMLDLREGVEKLPETAATFTLNGNEREKSNRTILDDHAGGHITTGMICLLGSWPVSQEIYTGNTHTGNNYVNPAYPDKRRFAEAGTRCNCGATMIRSQRTHSTDYRGEHKHTEECQVWDRLRARARIAENRAEIIQQQLWIGGRLRGIVQRLGLERDSTGEIPFDLGLEPETLRERGYEVRHRTWALLGDEYPISMIAEAYDYNERYVRRRINEYIAEHGEPDASDYYDKKIAVGGYND